MWEYRYLFEIVIPFPLDIYSPIICMFVPSQNSFVETLTLKFNDIIRWSLWEIGHERWTLVNGISALMKDTSQRSLVHFFYTRTKFNVSNSQEGPPCWYSDLRLLASRIVRNKLLFLSHPVCDILFQNPSRLRYSQMWNFWFIRLVNFYFF